MIVECPHCGKENRPEARFCRYCGQAFVLVVSAVPIPASEEVPDQQPDTVSALEDVTDQQPDGTPLLPVELAIGQLLLARYRIHRVLLKTEGSLTYEAEDILRCSNCQAIQTEETPRYCEVCGADLVQPPLVYLHASQQIENMPDEGEQDSFINGGVLYKIELPAPLPQTSSLSTPLSLISGFQSHSGKVRENNEDSLITLHLAGMCDRLCTAALGFFAIADGVGGAASGEVASQAAVRSLTRGVMQRIFDREVAGSVLPDEELPTIFQEIILEANQAILDLRSQMDDNDMGCTLTAALVRGTQALVANVGDSRTYRLQQGKLSLVTQDHSVVARLVEQGLLQPEEVYTHFQRSMIYRSLGVQPGLDVDIFTLELSPGERLLLCSDGLWEMVRDGMIEDVLLERYDPQQACDRLVELANLAGGEDNVSVIVLNVLG